MIFRTVHLPALYQAVGNPDRAAVCYNLLKSMAVNCVILDGMDEELSTEIAFIVKQWPTEYQLKGSKLVEAMRKRHLFVRTYVGPVDKKCPNSGCDLALALLSQKPDHTIVPEHCLSCGRCQIGAPNVSSVVQYSASDFEETREAGEDGGVGFNEMTARQFARLRLAPVFKHAQTVVFVDKVFGRLFLEGVASKSDGELQHYLYKQWPTAAGPFLEPDIAENYKRTITWIYDVFKNSATADRKLHICTELPLRHHRNTFTELQRDAAEKAFIEYASSLRDPAKPNDHHVEIACMRTGGQVSGEVTHDRYLVTDQVAVNFGRGLDLQTAGGQIRDTEVHIVKNRDRVCKKLKKLYPRHATIQSLP